MSVPSLQKFCLLLFLLAVGSLFLAGCGDPTALPQIANVNSTTVASQSTPTNAIEPTQVPPTTVAPTTLAALPTVSPPVAQTTTPVTTQAAPTTKGPTTVTFSTPYFSVDVPTAWKLGLNSGYDKHYPLVEWQADNGNIILNIHVYPDPYDKKVAASFDPNQGWTITSKVQAGSLEGVFGVLDDKFRPTPPPGTGKKYQNAVFGCAFPANDGKGTYSLSLGSDYRSNELAGWREQFLSFCQSLRPGAQFPQPETATSAPVSTAVAGNYPGKLVYDLRFQAAPPQIFTSNSDGTQRSQFAVSAVSPLFSPDGTRLAFVTDRPNPDPAKPDTSTSMIVSAKLDGSDRQILCEDGTAFVRLVRWSPRGRYIAITEPTDKNVDVIKLCDTTTKKIVTLPPNKQGQVVQSFDWTPDGNYAVWQVLRADNTSGVYYGDPDKNGADAVLIMDGPKPSEDGSTTFYGGVRFSPDGKTVAIGAAGKVVFVDLPGMSSPLKGKTSPVPVQVSSLAWSPDGRALAFVGCPVEPQDVCQKTLKVVDIASGQIFNPSDKTNIYGVEWSRQ